ncbi:MAG: ABC transporter permease, partial [Hyphomicrobiales bacterium]|nr:ABC transporter permease [Hyphomicrobiales bacterium]
MSPFGHKPPPSAVIGLTIVGVYLFVAVFGPLFAPYGQATPVGSAWAPASASMWLGGDQIGRDMLTRLIYGARTTIGIATVTTCLSFTIGCSLG